GSARDSADPLSAHNRDILPMVFSAASKWLQGVGLVTICAASPYRHTMEVVEASKDTRGEAGRRMGGVPQREPYSPQNLRLRIDIATEVLRTVGATLGESRRLVRICFWQLIPIALLKRLAFQSRCLSNWEIPIPQVSSQGSDACDAKLRNQ